MPHPSRRDVVHGGVLLLATGLAGCTTAPGAGPAPTPSTTPAEELPAAELLARVLAAVGPTPSASVTHERGQADGGWRWTVGGQVEYDPDGTGRAAAKFDTSQGPAFDVLVVGGSVYEGAGRGWARMRYGQLPRTLQEAVHELLDASLLLGPAGRVEGAVFRRAVASAPDTQSWVATLDPAEWAADLPPDLQDFYPGALGFDVLLTLDAAGRPVSRIDALRPNNLQVTVLTTWTDWGRPVDVPTAPPA